MRTMKRSMDEMVSVFWLNNSMLDDVTSSIIRTLCEVSIETLGMFSSLQEEENARLNATKRRLQREVEELTEQNEQLTRDLHSRKG